MATDDRIPDDSGVPGDPGPSSSDDGLSVLGDAAAVAATDLRERIEARAREIGFALVGVADPRPSEHGDFLRTWLHEGRHGGMEYLARPEAVERRVDLRRTMPSVRSVLVVAENHHLEDPEGVPGDPSRGVIARYARGRDYHRIIEKKLERLHRFIEEEAGREVEARRYVDHGPILERELARRAGIGWFGKNTLILHPEKGSYFFLGVLLLDLELPPDAPFEDEHCGSCSRCVEACPTDALLGRDEDGAPVIDARRCISYLTIEHRGPIPRELRPAMGNRVFGCDICQEVCPWNEKFAEETGEEGYAPRGPGELPAGVEPLPGEGAPARGRADPGPLHPGTDAPSLVELLRTAVDEERWEAFSRGSPIRRAGRGGFARNVCVAMGNWLAAAEEPPEAAVAVLVRALDDDRPLVRRHAAWALGEADGPAASEALSARLGVEEDGRVREECQGALSGSG